MTQSQSLNLISQRLAIFYFAYYAIIGTTMPYWNLYLEHQGLNYQQIGWLSSIAIITRFFAPFIWGWIADKTAKRMLLIRIACAVECLIWLVLFFIPNTFQNIALLLFIFSFFQNAILAQFESVTLFYLGNEKEQRYANIRKWGSIGFIAGVFIIGGILELFPIYILPMLLLGVTAVAFAWSFRIAEPVHAPAAQKHLQPLLPVLKQRPVWGFFAVQFMLLCSHAPFYSFYSNYLNQQHYSTSSIGLLWSIGVIAEIVMFALSAWFFRYFQLRLLVIFCLVLTALRWCMVGWYPQLFTVQIIAQLLHAFSFGLFHLIAMRMISNYFSAEQQGRGQAIYSTVWGLGVAIGSVIAGQYWQSWGGDTMFILAGVVCMMAVLLVPLLPKRFL